MIVTGADCEYIFSMGFYDFVEWDGLFMCRSGDYIYGDDYRAMLSCSLQNNLHQYLSIRARLMLVCENIYVPERVLVILAELCTIYGLHPEFKMRTPLQFLQWVIQEMTILLNDSNLDSKIISDYSARETSESPEYKLELGLLGHYEILSWGADFGSLDKQIKILEARKVKNINARSKTIESRKPRHVSYREVLGACMSNNKNRCNSILVRLRSIAGDSDIGERPLQTIARLCATDANQPEFVKLEAREFLNWVISEMEAVF